jgi:hypothetical protein
LRLAPAIAHLAEGPDADHVAHSIATDEPVLAYVQSVGGVVEVFMRAYLSMLYPSQQVGPTVPQKVFEAPGVPEEHGM